MILKRLSMAGALTMAAALGLGPAAHADDSSSSTIAGYTASAQALGAQFGFDIPNLVPLPNENLIEADAPFSRTSVGDGPVVNALGAPYYPGDILANFGSLLAEFGAPPGIPNDPLLAEADYPPSPTTGENSSFGGTPPAGSPLAPNVFSATAHADQNGGTVTSTLLDLQVNPPSSTSSSLATLGAPAPSSASGSTASGTSGSTGSGTGAGSVLGSASSAGGSTAPAVGGGTTAAASPALDIGSIQATNGVTVGSSAIGSTASSVVKAIDVAGQLDISELESTASSTSDGNNGTPASTLKLLGVTVDGQPAYIDQQGVHVSGSSTSSSGVTPAQAQAALDGTFSQDGISVRLLDPKTTTNGADGSADSGGLVISFTHQFDVPFIPGEPVVPIPELGNTALPAGLYSAITTVTLGSAVTDASATTLAPSGGLGVALPISPSTLGPTGALASTGGGVTTTGTTTFSGTGTGTTGGNEALSAGAPTAHRLPLGIPVPLGWVIVALILCVIFTYPMLLTVRWQFLSGRSR